jgi:nucleotide-binding universal stress UspA family protein
MADRDAIVVGFTKDGGDVAVEAAVAEARRRDGRLVVIHSMESGPDGEREIREYREHQEALEEVEARLAEAGIPVKTGMHIRGLSPADELAQTIDEEDAVLLVIGYRRRSRTSKYLLGSDTQEILIAAPCPVLAVGRDLV